MYKIVEDIPSWEIYNTLNTLESSIEDEDRLKAFDKLHEWGITFEQLGEEFDRRVNMKMEGELK